MSTLLIALFSQSAFVQLLLLTVFGLICLALSLGLLRVFKAVYPRLDKATPVPTFIGTIATAWALALGFAAADVWTARSHAEQASSEERSAISRLVGMAQQDALDIPEMLAALGIYERSVRQVEWGEGANREPIQEVDQALQQIRLSIVRMANDGVPFPLISKMTQDFDELQDARNKRLAIGTSSVSQYKWYLVLFLTFLSMVSIGAVHAERPPAAYTSLGIFMVAAVVSLWILALHATPYAGSAGISFQEVHFPLHIP